jgi:hypothetical protein
MPSIQFTNYPNNTNITTILPAATNTTNSAVGITQFNTNTPILSTYLLAAIANAVPLNSGTATVVWSGAIPSSAVGQNVILSIFFNLYNASTQFAVNQTFNYGIYINGTAISADPNNSVIPYTQTTLSNYAMSSAGVLLGTNGILGYKPIMITVNIPTGATSIQIGISNSSVALTTATQIGVAANLLYYTKNF